MRKIRRGEQKDFQGIGSGEYPILIDAAPTLVCVDDVIADCGLEELLQKIQWVLEEARRCFHFSQQGIFLLIEATF